MPISSFKTILFATNLEENCKPAFELAVSMASRYKANLVLLHVLEQMPDYLTARLKDFMGEKQWNKIIEQNANFAREVLIGKRSSIKLIKEALGQFCIDAGIDDALSGYHSREIVVADGEIVEEIIAQAKNYHADLIIMGDRKGFLSDNRIGHCIKSVMRQCHLPVMVVPQDI